MRIAVVGMGKLGACLAAVLADAGHQVIGVDSDLATLKAIAGNAPNPEPGLNDLLASVGDAMMVTDSLSDAVQASEMTLVVVPTPSTPNGDFDATAVRTVARAVKEAHMGTHTLVVVSTVSPGTMGPLAKELDSTTFGTVYGPSFIALGSVIADMRTPDFRLLGGGYPDTAVVAQVWRAVNPVRVFTMGLAEAEIAKLAVNAALVFKSAYANTIAMACQNTAGVDARKVLEAVGSDRRIGGAFLKPGSAVGGPCLPRDAAAVAEWLGRAKAPPNMAHAAQAVTKVQYRAVCDFFDPYATIAVLGLAYKPGTPVTEASLGSWVAELMEHQRKAVVTHDPYHDGPPAEEVIADADAVLVATAHPEYEGLDTQGKPTLDMWGCCLPGPNVTTWGHG